MRSRAIQLFLGAALTLAPIPASAGDGPTILRTDTDGDGIEDSVDRCPETAGSIDYKGCPSPDELGVANDEAKRIEEPAVAVDSPPADDGSDFDAADGTAVTLATIGGITMGIGALAVLVSGGLWIACGATRNDVNYAATNDDGVITGITQREARDQLELADELETSAAVTASVGGGLVLTGLVLLLVSAAVGVGAAVTENQIETIGVAPNLSPDGGSLDLTIRF